MEIQNSITQQIHQEASLAEQKILEEVELIIRSSENGAIEKADKIRSQSERWMA